MKRILLTVLIIACSLGCSKPDTYDYPESVPEDFSVSLTWNCFGVSSYDSETGKLVKTTDATNPADYVTYYQLTNEDKSYIYDLIVSMDVYSYPDVYDPNENLGSDPPMTLILKVKTNGDSKEIKAEDIAREFTSQNKKGQMYLSTCKAIINRLQSTDEWKALPEYEFFYD